MKKLLLTLLLGMMSFSASLTGPRYRVEGSFSALPVIVPASGSFVKVYVYVSALGSFLPEWKSQINDKLDITFGPKITAGITNKIGGDKISIFPNVVLGIETDFNYKVKENIKVYSSIEVGLGVGADVEKNKDIMVEPAPSIILKLALGAKINDKYNVGAYMGYGKSFLGIEFGYTF